MNRHRIIHTQMCEKLKKFKDKFFYMHFCNAPIINRACSVCAQMIKIYTINKQGEKTWKKFQKN